jgi:glycosyltransferase involved in cell wall biosynthesis
MTIDLSLPLSDKIGWPWSIENSINNNRILSTNIEYPKITVVTPNYNYGHYLEETIRSVLIQGYPNLEYIIIDGGSTDKSVEIIKKYEPWITYWESKPDRGQTHAINKGLELATGEVFNWINSDDILRPDSLFAIAQGIQGYDAFVGVVNNFYEQGKQVKVFPQNITATGLLTKFTTSDKPRKKDTVYHQPGFWFRTQFLKGIGSLDESLSIQFDFDRLVRYIYHHPNVNYTDRTLIDFRCHQEQKTAPGNIKQEGQIIARGILDNPDYENLHESAKLMLDRLNWYENITEITNQSQANKILKALKVLLLSCNNPEAYWTRYTFGSIRQLLTR